MSFDRNILILLALYHLSGILFVQTSFVPDEYWQATEVAHNLQFGYGYLTWEWEKAIRSCFYPRIISIIYKIFPDTMFTLVTLPRVFQALLSALGDYFTVKLSMKHFGNQTGKWTLFCILTSWFLFYCSSRTLTNMAETSFSTWGLYLYPWRRKQLQRLQWTYLWLAGLSTMVRPTAAIFWLPLCLRHIWQERKDAVSILTRITFVGVVMFIMQVSIDYSCYNRWVLSPLQFFVFNWTNNIGEFYGSHPWHWYFTVGFPIIMFTHYIVFVIGLRIKCLYPIYYFVFIYVLILSQLGHKEFRFLLPIMPLCFCICGASLTEISLGRMSLWRWKLKANLSIIIGLFIVFTNIPIGLYFGLLHQQGTLSAMNFLSNAVTQESSILYLMPCHSTPFYSHIHRNIPMKFLTCEPNFNNISDYVDEADLFYQNPPFWLKTYFKELSQKKIAKYPSHIVMFSNLVDTFSDILGTYNYQQCFLDFYAHFFDTRTGENIHIYCKQ